MRTQCQGHGFPWMCEGEYTPGRDLVGEVHAVEQTFVISPKAWTHVRHRVCYCETWIQFL